MLSTCMTCQTDAVQNNQMAAVHHCRCLQLCGMDSYGPGLNLVHLVTLPAGSDAGLYGTGVSAA